MPDNRIAAETRLPVEPAGPDFPYYRDKPPTMSPGGWLTVVAAVALGFAALVTPAPFEDSVASGWLRTAAFVGLPLVGLTVAAGPRWKLIFGLTGLREVKLMVAFAALNILVSLVVGLLVKRFGTVSTNAGVADAARLEGARLASYFARTGVQLLGEELLTILPFLAILSFCHSRAGIGRNAAVLIAWLVSAAAFGLLHLPTYDWNIVQCLVVIGSARLVLTWAYVWSKNIWVSTGAHILNDWAIISATVFLTPPVAGLGAAQGRDLSLAASDGRNAQHGPARRQELLYKLPDVPVLHRASLVAEQAWSLRAPRRCDWDFAGPVAGRQGGRGHLPASGQNRLLRMGRNSANAVAVDNHSRK